MGAAYFYHLTRRPLPETLAMLLDKARGQGWRVAVRSTDAASLPRLSAALWNAGDESFLAHGIAGGPHDADQPILLTTDASAANQPTCVMSVGGATVTPDEIASLERVCILFDGHDPAAVDEARQQWKAVKDSGAKAQYWSEESGRWELKSQT